MNALERLRAVLCAPDGEVVIDGTDADRSIVAEALEDLDAALSQTAGVPYGWLHAVEYIDGICPPDFVKGAERPKGHLDQLDAETRSIVAETFVTDHFTPLYAAPAASGGEDGPNWRYAAVSALEYLEVGDTENAIGMLKSAISMHAPQPPAGASQSSNPNPVTPGLSSESAASVSERARDE